jgi:hypothetical protein
MSHEARMERFLKFSSEVTAFSEFELRGTGQADAYLASIVEVVGHATVDELLDAYGRVGAETGAAREDLLRREIFSDDRLGPIARNVIKLWYVGIWYELPHAWQEQFGRLEHDRTHTISATAYTEGLLWPAMGANPPGAKAPGYATWTSPPQIPPIPSAR